MFLLERGIPFCKDKGFPSLSPCYVTNCEFPLKISLKTVSYIPSYDLIKRYMSGFPILRIIALSHGENTTLILNEYIVTMTMCKVSFKDRQL